MHFGVQHSGEEIIDKSYDHRIAMRLLGYTKPYWKYISIATAMLFLISFLELIGPYIIKTAIDVHIKNKDIPGLRLMAILYVLSLIGSGVFRYIQSYLTMWIGQKIMFDLRNQIFAHTQSLSLSFFDKNPIGRILTRITNDVEVLNELFTQGVVTFLGDIFLLIGILIAMLILNWELTLVISTTVPVLIYVTNVFRRKIRISYKRLRVKIAKINAYLQENISGIRIVQIFNREKKNEEDFDKINADFRDENLLTIFYYSLFFPTIEVINHIAIALLIWYGGGQVIQNALTLGLLVAFIEYVQKFFRPIRDLSEKYNMILAAMASSERIFQLLDTKPVVNNPDTPLEIKEVFGDIEFRNVWFAYNSNNGSYDYVLKNISFKVKRGEKIALVGATGAGKTSIINLLGRYYDVQKGEILIDGVDIRKIKQEDLRKNIGVVLQDVFVFSGNILSNIRLGRNDIPLERVVESARYVNADRFISRLPKGYYEETQERGSTLSVGQRQLLAFARALAYNPKILILDEATSSIDTETEALIQDAINKLLEGRTAIIIAHRLSTIQKADRIIVLHKGEIREEGNHQELLKKRGLYYKLYQLQFGIQDDREKN